MKSLLIFVHYSKGAVIPPDIKKYVLELAPHFSDVIISTNYKGPSFGNVKVMSFKNEGYDFGLFYRALQKVDIKEYERIAFVNDSNVLVGSFKKVFKWGNENKCEMWGLTDSQESPPALKGKDTYHIQSHFMILEKKAITLLPIFFKNINFEKYLTASNNALRVKIINNCEIGLSQFMLNKGVKLGSYFSVKDKASPNFIFANYRHNVHVYKWEELIKGGYPLIKRKLVEGAWAFVPNWKRCYKYKKR
jgi:lipopolysaccharide biosynthesis protein